MKKKKKTVKIFNILYFYVTATLLFVFIYSHTYSPIFNFVKNLIFVLAYKYSSPNYLKANQKKVG